MFKKAHESLYRFSSLERNLFQKTCAWILFNIVSPQDDHARFLHVISGYFHSWVLKIVLFLGKKKNSANIHMHRLTPQQKIGDNPSPSSSKAGTGALCGASARFRQLGTEMWDWHHSAPHTSSAALAPHPCSHFSVSEDSQPGPVLR